MYFIDDDDYNGCLQDFGGFLYFKVAFSYKGQNCDGFT